MKVVIVTQYYPPEIGAPQARLSELARHLVERGHHVTVLTAMPNYPAGKIHPGYGGLLRTEPRDGTNVIRTAIYPTQKIDTIRRLASYFSFVMSASFFGSFLLKRSDYLLVESPPLFLGLAGLWLSRVKRTRMIFNVSDLWPESAVRLGVLKSDALAYRLSSWLESFCYRSAWLVTGQSNGILTDISNRFPACPTYHLSNGVDIDKFRPGLPHAEIQGASRNGRLLAMYAGLHGLAQGLDQVLKAAAELDERHFHFVLVGDGPEKHGLTEQATRERLLNVQFCDARPAAEIPQILAGSDIVLVMLKTYIPGAVPSKLYEAMAIGRPVVLVGKGEPANIVRKYNTGIAVDPGNIREFVQALRTLRDNPELRRTMGENGRKAVEQAFDRKKIIGRFIDHLEQAQPRARPSMDS